MCHKRGDVARSLAVVWAVATVLGTISVWAQESVPSILADPPVVIPTTDELIKKGPKVAVETAAEVLGMVRGVQRSTTSLNIVEVVASGTMAERGADGTWRDYNVTRLTEQVDFVIPAARLEIVRSASNGRSQRSIQVVAGMRAWDEEKPGINGTPVTANTADRNRMIWLIPQGAMWGALRAAEGGQDVQLANERGHLAISYVLNGEPIKLVLGTDLLPERVQIQARSGMYANTLLEATYAQYKDFSGTPQNPTGWLAPCPSRITYAAGGRRIRQLTVIDCNIDPYVIFPLPANIAKTN